MSIRVGIRAMARVVGPVAPRPPEAIFTEDFDWKEEWSGDLIFSEDFFGWP